MINNYSFGDELFSIQSELTENVHSHLFTKKGRRICNCKVIIKVGFYRLEIILSFKPTIICHHKNGWAVKRFISFLFITNNYWEQGFGLRSVPKIIYKYLWWITAMTTSNKEVTSRKSVDQPIN